VRREIVQSAWLATKKKNVIGPHRLDVPLKKETNAPGGGTRQGIDYNNQIFGAGRGKGGSTPIRVDGLTKTEGPDTWGEEVGKTLKQKRKVSVEKKDGVPKENERPGKHGTNSREKSGGDPAHLASGKKKQNQLKGVLSLNLEKRTRSSVRGKGTSGSIETGERGFWGILHPKK